MTTSAWIGNRCNLSDGLAYGVLTGEEQYRAELARCPHLTRKREQHLVDRARTGDAHAGEELVTGLLRGVECIASRYYNGYAKSWQRLEYLDLIQDSNLALVSNLVVALEQPNPCANLLAASRGAIQRYCYRNRSSIRTPETPGFSPVIVESLDIPLYNGEGQTLLDVLLDAAWGATSPASDERDYTALHQAIDSLPTMQRTVTLRHYGLRDAPPEGMEAPNQVLYGKQHKMGYVHRRLALARLRGMLAPAYPQYTQERATHLRPNWISPTLQTLTHTREQQQRLERAHCALLASGEKITVERLRKEARVREAYARAYLRQLRTGIVEAAPSTGGVHV